MARDYDAVVIGGGPAGAMSALHLAEAGWRTLLVEKRAALQGKACGYCLGARALAMLERIDLGKTVVHRAPERIHTLLLHDPSGSISTIALTSSLQQAGVLVERSWFDELLRRRAEQAGARVLREAAARVEQIDRDCTSVVIRTRDEHMCVSSSLVVGADGLGSRTGRSLGLGEGARCGRKFGFSVTIDAGHFSDIDLGSVHMFVVQGGYLGAVRLGDDRLHLAALIGPTAAQRVPVQFAEHVASVHEELQPARLSEALRTCSASIHAAGPMPYQPGSVANRFGVLVGDAAGYVEPFTGEGMTWALESADTLGEVTRPLAPGTWSAQSATRYEHRWRSVVANRHRFCRAATSLIERPALLAMVNRTVLQLPFLSGRMVRRVAAA